MANDRIYIRCSTCGKQKLVAKYYPTLVADTVPDETFAFWMYEHMHPPCREVTFDLAGDPGFVLITESGELSEHPRAS